MSATTPPVPRGPWQVRFVVLALIWGASFLLIKLGLRAYEPLQVATARILLGAVTVLLLLRLTGGRLPRERRVWAHLVVVALLLGAIPFVLFPLGEERVSSALAGIGNAVTPLATVVATAALLPDQRLPRAKTLAVLAGFGGVVLISQVWEAEAGPDVLGFGFTLLAGASYGLGWTWVRRFLGGADLGGLALPAALLTMASVQMTVLVTLWWLPRQEVLAAPWSARPGADASLTPALAVAVLGIVGTGLAYLLQFDIVRAVGPQVASLVTYLIPVVSVVLGYLVLGERLGAWQLVGAVVVLGSAIAVGRPSRAAHRDRAAGVRAPSRPGTPTS